MGPVLPELLLDDVAKSAGDPFAALNAILGTYNAEHIGPFLGKRSPPLPGLQPGASPRQYLAALEYLDFQVAALQHMLDPHRPRYMREGPRP